MKKFLTGTIVALIVLAAAGAVAAAVTSESDEAGSVAPAPPVSFTATGDEPTSPPALKAGAQVGDGDDEAPKPGFIGIAVRPVTSEEAEDPGQEGRARVVKVFPDGPADGVLAEGDIIVAIDGEDMPDLASVREKARSTPPGEVIEITLWGIEQPVSITVGEFEKKLYQRPQIKKRLLKRFGPLHGLGHGTFGLDPSKVVSGELVVEDGEGLKTLRVTGGALENVDADGKTLTLAPKDGSSPVTYTAEVEGDNPARIIVGGRQAELADLNTEDPTIVATVTHSSDNVERVLLVVQGGLGPHLAPLSRLFGAGLNDRFGLGGSGLFGGIEKRLSLLDVDELLEGFELEDEGFRFRLPFGGRAFTHEFAIECQVEKDPDDPNKFTKHCTKTETPAPADETTQ